MNEKEYEYWKKYYNNGNLVNNGDEQKNVGRTKNGVAISNTDWTETVAYIKKIIFSNNNKKYKLLELCCGNGQVLNNLADQCEFMVGVDYSDQLLDQIKLAKEGVKLKLYHSNVLDFCWKENSLDVVIIYFAIQHFSEKDTLLLIENSLSWLNQGGILFIGDVPDSKKKWKYISQPTHRMDYLKRLLEDKPMIGNWFDNEFFESLIHYFKDIEVETISQPSFLINSDHRFDVLIKKCHHD